jgi:hypothetical protein
MLWLAIGCASEGSGETLGRAQLVNSTSFLEDSGDTLVLSNGGDVRLGVTIVGITGAFSASLGEPAGGVAPDWDDRDTPADIADAVVLDPGASVPVAVTVGPEAPADAWGALRIGTVGEVASDVSAQSRVYADLDDAWTVVWLHAETDGPADPTPGQLLAVTLGHTGIEV